MGVIRYLGHSFFEVSLMGLDGVVKNIAIDPWVNNPLSPIRLEDYRRRRLDYIIVTHDHGDHLGNTVELARITGATVIGVYEVAVNIAEKGVKTIDGNIGGPLNIQDLEVILTSAVHSSSRGTPVGVVVRGKDLSVYHAGDTGVFSDMALIGELYKPRVALLPIGGHYTMGIREAVKAVELLKPEIVIPMHYNTFPVIKADPLEFKRLVEEKTRSRVVVLKPGEEFTYP
ncbi:MAG: metal-dependent hydrolase [Desulfurococcus sp.]|nr:metal-dependent hydrolase [Desulfurococcus sp.]